MSVSGSFKLGSIIALKLAEKINKTAQKINLIRVHHSLYRLEGKLPSCSTEKAEII